MLKSLAEKRIKAECKTLHFFQKKQLNKHQFANDMSKGFCLKSVTRQLEILAGYLAKIWLHRNWVQN